MDEINFTQIKRLWNLKLVIDSGSIKRGATRANVTSSAMSQSISGLEASVGRKLLIRKKDLLQPTEYALQLLKSAEATFSTCRDLQNSLSMGCRVQPKIAWMDFAASESLAIDVLPGIMQRLRKHFPDIRLKIKTGRSCELTKLVKKGELCMAVVEENELINPKHAFPLTEDRLGFYVSTQNMMKRPGPRLIDELGIGCLSAGPEGYPLHFTKFIRPLGKSFKPTMTSDSYEILRAAAVQAAVVAILPRRVAERRAGELVEISAVASGGEKVVSPGGYKIFLISEPGCAPEENIFLAEELKSLIAGHERRTISALS